MESPASFSHDVSFFIYFENNYDQFIFNLYRNFGPHPVGFYFYSETKEITDYFRKDEVTIKAEPGSPIHSEHEVSPQSISQSG